MKFFKSFLSILTLVVFSVGILAFATNSEKSEITTEDEKNLIKEVGPNCPCPDNTVLTLNAAIICTTGTTVSAFGNCGSTTEGTWTWTWTALGNCTISGISGNTATVTAVDENLDVEFRVKATLSGCTGLPATKGKRFVLSADDC